MTHRKLVLIICVVYSWLHLITELIIINRSIAFMVNPYLLMCYGAIFYWIKIFNRKESKWKYFFSILIGGFIIKGIWDIGALDIFRGEWAMLLGILLIPIGGPVFIIVMHLFGGMVLFTRIGNILCDYLEKMVRKINT